MSFIIIGARVGVYSQEPTPDGDPYDLGTVPFAYDWPTAPTTSNGTTNCTTMAEFQAAVQTSGYIVNFNVAGTYGGNIEITGSDLDIRVANDVFFDGGILRWGDYQTVTRPARVKWTGGNLINGGMVLDPIDDLLVDDFFVNNDADVSPENIHNMSGQVGPEYTGIGVVQGFNRVAFINSTIGLYDANPAGGWTWICNPNGTDTGSQGGMILANVKLISDGQNNRFLDHEGLIIVDCVFNPDNASTNGMRLHAASNNVFIKDTTVVNFILMNGTGAQATNCTVEGLTNYNPVLDTITQSASNTGSIADSTFYHSTGGSWGGASPFTDLGGNSWQAWDGSTLPDFSAIGAVRP
jgi:hypothetical protein